MPRTRIKICGVCRPQDALTAARAGADAVGIIFDRSSKRFSSIDEALNITSATPPMVTPIGVFAASSPNEIRETLRRVPLATVQLQGDEPPEFVAELKPIRIIKALHLKPGHTQLLDRWRTAIRDLNLTNLIGILLETATTSRERGGTGIPNDFAGLAAMQSSGAFSGLPPIIAAGGLTPQNVGEVVRLLRPWAVDVSSGVESALREKSPEKIEAFVRAVREADGRGSI